MFKPTSFHIKIDFNTICKFRNIFLYFYMFRYTISYKKYIIHFYNEHAGISESVTDLKLQDAVFSKFINKDYKCYEHTTCTNCYRIEISSKYLFPLKFNLTDPQAEINNIYIKCTILNHNEFIFFKYFFQEFPSLKENVSYKKMLRFIRMFDVIEFEKDKKSKIIIEKMLEILFLSIAYNIVLQSEDIICDELGMKFSVSFLKELFFKILEIFLFDRKFINDIKLKHESDIHLFDNQINETINLNDFFWFNTELFEKLSKKIGISLEFKNLLKNIFRYFPIKKVIFSRICENTVDFLSLYSFLPSIDELCLISCSNISFLKQLSEYGIFKTTKRLTIINSRIYICSQDFFKLINSFDSIIFSNSNFFESCSLTENIFLLTKIIANFTNEMTNNNKNRNFFSLKNNIEYEINTKNYKLSYLCSQTSFKDLDCKSKNHSVRIYYSVNIEYEFIKFYLLILNFEQIIYFDIYLENIYIKGLIFEEINIKNKVKNIYIFNTKVSESFLNDVLLFPSLISISFEMCYFEFENLDLQFKNNQSIIYLKIDKKCEINDFAKMIEFINALVNLESLCLHYNDLNLLGISLYENNKFSLRKIKKFEFYETNYDENNLPNFSFFPNIQELVIGKNFQDGVLSNIFSYENMCHIHRFNIDGFIIGSKDRAALQNLRNLWELRLEHCDFKNITFSDLFDMKNEYLIQKLKLTEILLEERDILFISKLIFLKNLNLNFLIFKNFSYLKLKLKCFKEPIRIELIITIRVSLKNEIRYFMEEFGPKSLNLR